MVGIKLGRVVCALAVGCAAIACKSDPDAMNALTAGAAAANSSAGSMAAAGTAPPSARPIAGFGGNGAVTPAGSGALSGSAGSTSMGAAGSIPAGPVAGMLAPEAGAGGAAEAPGTAGMSAAGSGAAAGGPAQPPETVFKPPCMTGAADLATLGDSYVNYTETLTPQLTALAVKDGSISSGAFKTYAVPGVSSPSIPGQLSSALSGNPKLKFIVMDGGGNDVLLGAPQCLADGSATSSGCQGVVATALKNMTSVVEKAKSSGVSQIAYFFYPDVPAGGKDILAYAFPMLQKMCEGASTDTFQCYMIDTRPTFAGHADYFAFDGIHPSGTGMPAMARAIWDVMKSKCMARPAGSGCCTP